RRDRAPAAEHAHTEGERALVTGSPAGAVLGGGRPRLDDLDPEVRVAEMSQPAASVAQQVARSLSKGLDEVDAQRRGHQNGSTTTRSPGATSPRSSSSTIRQLPATIELRMPEPWGPVVRTYQAPSRCSRMPRLNSRRPVRFRMGSAARASHVSGKIWRRP